jgi:hypothetical protein
MPSPLPVASSFIVSNAYQDLAKALWAGLDCMVGGIP